MHPYSLRSPSNPLRSLSDPRRSLSLSKCLRVNPANPVCLLRSLSLPKGPRSTSTTASTQHLECQWSMVD
ncbi:hypothetical protein PLANTIT3_50099 [Plantibacter sp. T3]|nr:hypothetical protein PLANTIT3_50099 [Plantibacter sp. T3]